MTPSRRTLLHLAALTALCALAYLPGLTDHGLTNWQEAVRLLAAQEMDERDDWVRPTIHGETYLAKPPLMYWSQLAVARLRGEPVGLFDLRLTVALAGWLGVLATYWCARTLLRDRTADDPMIEGGQAWAAAAAFWSAAAVATGVLTARAARIGELDILLVTFTPLAVGASFHAATAPDVRRALAWIALSAAAFTGLSLAKGPPGMLTAALAILGGSLLNVIGNEHTRPRQIDWILFGGPVVAAMFMLSVVTRREAWADLSIADIIGILFFVAAIAALIALLLGSLANPRGLRAAAVSTVRTAWPLAAAIGFAALYLWSVAVERAAPASGVTTAAASEEAADNISLFVLNAPLRALEVFAYGAGLGSVAAIAFLVWCAKDRPKLPRGLAWACAWIALSMIVFSATTRGTHRYLLPMLPGVAILGGAWLASWLRDVAPRLGPKVLAAILALAAAGTGWWYGVGRDDAFAARSPRDFTAALVADPIVDPERIAVLDWWDPGLTIYAGHPVTPYADFETSIDIPHGAAPIAELHAELLASGDTATMIYRDAANPRFPDAPPARERLAELGFEVVRTPTTEPPPYLVDRRTNPMTYAVIRAADPSPGD